MSRLLSAVMASVAMFGLMGCATDRVAGQDSPGTMSNAMQSPLYDINVMRTKIPETLLDALDAPYSLPKPLTCSEIAAEVRPLDDALGPDLDMEFDANNPGMLARGHGLAINALGDAASSVIPMRGWVRKLTGAEQHDRYVHSAITAGGVRRAYLKGLGQSLRCRAPAAPSLQAVSTQPPGVYAPEPKGPKFPIR
jgi:hypothetical protein